MVLMVHLGLRVNLLWLMVHCVIGMRPALIHERLIVIVLSLVIVILLLRRVQVRIDGWSKSGGYSKISRFFGKIRKRFQGVLE